MISGEITGIAAADGGTGTLPTSVTLLNALISGNTFTGVVDWTGAGHYNTTAWWRIRAEAGLDDVRLHDLRRTHASHAVMNGVPVPVVSRLLGHSNTRMTLRYAHLGDRDIEQAAERVGQEMAALMGL